MEYVRSIMSFFVWARGKLLLNVLHPRKAVPMADSVSYTEGCKEGTHDKQSNWSIQFLEDVCICPLPAGRDVTMSYLKRGSIPKIVLSELWKLWLYPEPSCCSGWSRFRSRDCCWPGPSPGPSPGCLRTSWFFLIVPDRPHHYPLEGCVRHRPSWRDV